MVKIANAALDMGADAIQGKTISATPIINMVVDMAVAKALTAANADARQITLVKSLIAAVDSFINGKTLEGVQNIADATWAYGSPALTTAIEAKTGKPMAKEVVSSMKGLLDAVIAGNSKNTTAALWGIAVPIANHLIDKLELPKKIKTYTTPIRKLLKAGVKALATGDFKAAETALEAFITPVIKELLQVAIKGVGLKGDALTFVETMIKNDALMTAIMGGNAAKAGPLFITALMSSPLANTLFGKISPKPLQDQAKALATKALNAIVKSMFGEPKTKEEATLLQAIISSKQVSEGVNNLNTLLDIPTMTIGVAQSQVEHHALSISAALQKASGEDTGLVEEDTDKKAAAKFDQKDLVRIYADLNTKIYGNDYTILGASLGSQTMFRVTLLGVAIYPTFNKDDLIKAIGTFASELIKGQEANKGKPTQVGGSPIPKIVGICSVDTTQDQGPDFKEWTMTFFKLSMRFMAGPVPLSASIELIGQVGIAWKIVAKLDKNTVAATALPCTGGTTAVGAPFAGASIKIYGGVDALVAKAGIGAEIQLVRVSLPLTVDALVGGLSDNNCLSMNIVTQAGGGRFFIFVETILTGRSEFDMFQWSGGKWVWPKQTELPTVDGKQPKKLNFFGKCMYDQKYAEAMKQPHMDPPPNAYKTICACTLYNEPNFLSPMYKEDQAGNVTKKNTNFKDEEADGGYFEVDNIYGKTRKFREGGKEWSNTKSLKCIGNCAEVGLLSYDKSHKECSLNKGTNWKGTGVAGIGKQAEYTIFTMSDFSSKKGLQGNVCGIHIRANKNDNNPGPTLCEELLQCGQCNDKQITQYLKADSGGCVWNSVGWYDKKRDKKFKCGSTPWVKGDGSTTAGGSNKIAAATTDCTIDPDKCKTTTVSGKWTSADVKGDKLATIQYAKLDNTDCLASGSTTYNSLAAAQTACNNAQDSCGGVSQANGQFGLCKVRKTITKKMVLESSTKPEGLKATSGKGTCLRGTDQGLTTQTCESAQAVCSDDVTFYGEVGYKGWIATFGKGDYKSSDMVSAGASKGQGASIRVPAGCMVEIYPNDNMQGTPIVLSAGEYAKTPIAPEVEALLEEDIQESDDGQSAELLQTGWGRRRRAPPQYYSQYCSSYRYNGPAWVYGSGICASYRQAVANELYIKAQKRAFANTKAPLGLSSLKKIGSIRVWDDVLPHINLDSSGTIAASSKDQTRLDEYYYTSSGFLTQARTGTNVGIDNDLPSIMALKLNKPYPIPFCDRSTNTNCGGDKVPLMYLKYPSGGKYRQCATQASTTRATAFCKGCGFCCNSWNHCGNSGNWDSCPKILPGSQRVLKEKFNTVNYYYCDCPGNQCIYKNQCQYKSNVEKTLCLDSNVGGGAGLNTCNSNSANQRWKLYDYRTTWQYKPGSVVYKKGPKPVASQSLTQLDTCAVTSPSPVPFQGTIQGQLFSETKTMKTTGTVNGMQSMISWNTQPPAYWTLDGYAPRDGNDQRPLKDDEAYADVMEEEALHQGLHHPKMTPNHAKSKSFDERDAVDQFAKQGVTMEDAGDDETDFDPDEESLLEDDTEEDPESL